MPLGGAAYLSQPVHVDPQQLEPRLAHHEQVAGLAVQVQKAALLKLPQSPNEQRPQRLLPPEPAARSELRVLRADERFEVGGAGDPLGHEHTVADEWAHPPLEHRQRPRGGQVAVQQRVPQPPTPRAPRRRQQLPQAPPEIAGARALE